MSDPITETIKSIGHTLSAIFRHLIPGVLVLGAAAIARPSWFNNVDINSSHHLIVLSVLAVMVGNLWFVLHRYFIQQLVDLLFFIISRKKESYHSWVATLVCNFFLADSEYKDIKEHVKFRSSSVILMYITAEVIVAALCSAECGSILTQCKLKHFLIWLSIIIFLAAIWQNYIVLKIEQQVAKDGEKRQPKS